MKSFPNYHMAKLNLINFRTLLLFIIIVTNVYSFPLQYKILLDIFYLFFCFRNNMENMKNNYVLSGSVFLFFYIIVVSIFNENTNLYVVGKPLRFIFVIIAYMIYSSYLKKCSYAEIFYTVTAALSIHMIVVYVEMFFPVSKPFFYSFLDEFKEDTLEASFRAFGLCASFDEAGLILCVLIVLFGIAYRKNHSSFFILLEFIAYIGCFLVGRTAMVLSTLLILMDILKFFLRHKLLSSLIIFPALVYLGYHVYDYVVDIIEATDMRDSYADSSLEVLTGRMLYYPDTMFGWLFGTGRDAEASDIGYIKLLHQVGILGSLFIFHMYYYTNMHLRKYRKVNINAYLFMTMFVLMLFFYNSKGLFLYARGINDLYFLLYFILLKKLSYENNQIRRVL